MKLRGWGNGHFIEMHFDAASKTIITAFPIGR